MHVPLPKQTMQCIQLIQTPNTEVILGTAVTAGAVRPGAAHCHAGAPEGRGAAAKLQRFSGTTRAPSAAKQGGGTMARNRNRA